MFIFTRAGGCLYSLGLVDVYIHLGWWMFIFTRAGGCLYSLGLIH